MERVALAMLGGSYRGPPLQSCPRPEGCGALAATMRSVDWSDAHGRSASSIRRQRDCLTGAEAREIRDAAPVSYVTT